MRFGCQHSHHKGQAALRIFASQPRIPCFSAYLALCLNSVLNGRVLVDAFNQVKAVKALSNGSFAALVNIISVTILED